MAETTTYQPKFYRAGRYLDRDEAIEIITRGLAVVVAVPDEDSPGMGELKITITTGSDSGGDPCAYGKISPTVEATTRLHAGDLEVYAAVMTAAASLCDDANKMLATW